ncbi:MAG TPA: beta-eliminating lyase-related protein [Bacteroidales bacterium]|nr:beta-eliminating lyase-related protein [Bacteroidales bacterium]
MRSFASDNNSGVHPIVLEALQQANDGHAVGYGDDPWTQEALRLFKDTFGPLSESFIVLNGTGANIASLQLTTKPFNSIICSDTAHILVDECGAPVKSTGCPIFSIPTPDGKLTPAMIKERLHGFGDQHHSQPGVVYISQCTELGTVYTPAEIRDITALAHQYGLYVHMDGARIANAAAALNCSLRALTTDCGIDILSFGGTKNGLMMGESVVILNPELIKNALFIRKQSAQLASKMRYLSVQFTTYLKNDFWLTNASHANEMAMLLYHKLSNYPEVRFTQKPETNALFLTLPRPVIDELLKKWFFYFWNEPNNEIRLVCSFDTTNEDVQSFLSDLEKAFINYSL